MANTEVSSEVVDDVVDNQDEAENEEEGSENESAEMAEDQGEESKEGDDLVISLEGEEEAKPETESTEAPQWVKDLRKEHRETVRKLRTLEAEKADREAKAGQQKQAELGEKPTLASCDYDEEVYEPKLADWYKRKSEIEAKERDAQAQAERQNQEWQAKLEAHKKAASALRVSDYEEASETVKEAFSDIQYAIMHEADNSAVLEYAIEIGIKVPEVLRIVGYSNDPRAAIITPSITTIEQFPGSIGKVIVAEVLKLLKPNGENATVAEPIIVQVELIRRMST